MVEDISKLKKCPACSSENITYVKEDDRLVCNDCGEVFVKLMPEEEKKYKRVSDVI